MPKVFGHLVKQDDSKCVLSGLLLPWTCWCSSVNAAWEEWSANDQETCWTLWKANVKEMGDISVSCIYAWAPKVVVWPEALMELFECGSRGCFGGFSLGQICHQCERRFGLGMKVCVCRKTLSNLLSFWKGRWREPEDYKCFSGK